MTLSKPVNPYTTGRKTVPAQPESQKKPSIPQHVKSVPKKKTDMKQKPVDSSSGDATRRVTLSTSASKASAPSPSLKPASSSKISSSKTTMSLKQKLKQDIQNLKRQKQLQMQRIEEEKRRKFLEKQRRKQEAALRKRMEEQQKENEVQPRTTGMSTVKQETKLPSTSSTTMLQAPTMQAPELHTQPYPPYPVHNSMACNSSLVPTPGVMTNTLQTHHVTPSPSGIIKQLNSNYPLTPANAIQAENSAPTSMSSGSGYNPNAVTKAASSTTASPAKGAQAQALARSLVQKGTITAVNDSAGSTMKASNVLPNNVAITNALTSQVSAPSHSAGFPTNQYQAVPPAGSVMPTYQANFHLMQNPQMYSFPPMMQNHNLLSANFLAQPGAYYSYANQHAWQGWPAFGPPTASPCPVGAPAPSQASRATMPKRKSETKPKSQNKVGVNLLCEPLEAPSPFAATHTLLTEPIVLVRKPNESFGVTVKEETQSTLVDPRMLNIKKFSQALAQTSKSTLDISDSVENTDAAEGRNGNLTRAVSSDEKTGGSVGTTTPVDSRTTKRHTAFYVMMVKDPTVQNERSQSKDSNTQLMMGDIMLTIDGHKTAGRSLSEACRLFKSCGNVKDGMVLCTVTVARQKIPATSGDGETGACSQDAAALKSGPLVDTEIAAFAGLIVNAAMDSKRVLGSVISDDLLRKLLLADPELSLRSLLTLKIGWSTTESTLQRRMLDRAIAHWKKQWKRESAKVQSIGVAYLTDAQRSSMRAAPRPPRGCKCGSQDHDYVNDPSCPLYSDLRRFDDDTIGFSSSADRVKKLKSKLPRDLNAVEAAFKERFVRQIAETEAEVAEALFVSRMEEIQLKRWNKAIFAPSLTAMVLSAVFELLADFGGEPSLSIDPEATSNKEVTPSAVSAANDASDDDSDDEDDVPLSALGNKRPSSEAVSLTSKKQRLNVSVSRKFLAKLARLLSSKWGHVYREPADAEYAWRWEVYHGHVATDTAALSWNAHSKNPRQAGSFSLENVQFLLDEALISNIETDDGKKSLAHILSPIQSGICEELLALIQMEILRIDWRGIPVLAKEWSSKADILLLEDMFHSWGIAADPSGSKYGIVDEIRKPLDAEWVRTDHGWAQAEDDLKGIYEFSEFEKWRSAFEDKQQSYSDDLEGIGRFGI